jgi:TP901 family phage tail tape measure protein
MATTYTRRINLYINGREVRNDIASIRAELSKLTAQQAHMIRGSAEYNANMARIRELRGIISQHNQDLKYTSRTWGNLASFAGKLEHYQTLLFGVIGAVTGLVSAAKSATAAFAEYDDKVADVIKTTGLSKEEALSLSAALSSIDTRTSQNELLELARIAGKLGFTMQDELLGFVRAADQAVVALSQDLGGNVEETVRQLGKLVDIFKLEDVHGVEDAMLKVGSALNSLGAASTANEGYMVEFAKRVGGIAPISGISITSVLGLAATLDQLGQTSEVSATVFNRMIPKMFTDTQKYASLAGMSVEEFSALLQGDANEAFLRFLEGLRGNGAGFQSIAKDLEGLGLEGARVTGVLAALANNTGLLRQQQEYAFTEFERGVSLTNEFNVKNQTAQANLEKAIKKFREMAVALGQMLVPAVQGMVHKGSALVQILMATLTVVSRYKGAIITTAAAFVGYTAAVKLAWLWESRRNKEKGIGLALEKLDVLWKTASKGVTIALAGAQALLTGNIGRATAAMRLFNMVTKLNPVGLIVSGVTALGVGLWQLHKSLNRVSAVQRSVNEVNTTASQNIVEQQVALERLLRVAGDETRSLQEREEAVKSLNRLSPEFLGGLTLAGINSRGAAEATRDYTRSLLENARAIAAQEKLVELEKKRIEDVQSGKAARPSVWQTGWNLLRSAGNPAAFAGNNAVSGAKNLAASEKEYKEQREELYKIIDDSGKRMKKPPPIVPATLVPGAGDTESGADPLGLDGGTSGSDGSAESEASLPGDGSAGASTSGKSGKSPGGKSPEKLALKQEKELLERRQEVLEMWNVKRELEIRRDYRQRLTTQSQYEAAMLSQELEFMRQRQGLYDKDSAQYLELEVQIQDRLIAERARVEKLLAESVEVLEEARIEGLSDGLEKELALERQRYEKQKQAIREMMVFREGMSQEELSANENLNRALEEADAAHLRRERELREADRVGQRMMEAVEMEEKAVGLTQQHNALRAIARAQYEEDVLDAKGDHARIAKAERKLSRELIRIKMEEAQARAQIDEQIMQVAMDGFGVMAQLVGEETALGKALFLMQQAAAIGQVVFQTAIANAKAVAASPLTFGQPWVGINSASAAVSIASIVAQSIAKFTGSKTQFYAGGFTGDGVDDREVAGVVHAGEFVASAASVRNPSIRPVLEMIDRAQRSGSAARLNLLEELLGDGGRMPRFREGGFTTPAPAAVEKASVSPGTDPELKELLRRNLEVQQKLLAWKPRVATELIKRDLDTLDQIRAFRGL